MIGNRSFSSLKRKRDKKLESRKPVRARMRLTARVYLLFRKLYEEQSEIIMHDKLCNAADMFRRETISIWGRAINSLCEKADDNDNASRHISITDQKSGLKISILNLLKLNSKFLIGHFLVTNSDGRSKRVVDFLQVLKLFEDELFGDAYYDLNFRANVNSRKPINLPKDEDVRIILDECKSIMTDITATTLILFNARRGGEPVHLTIKQWEEAVNGEWVDEVGESPYEMLVTYQTGKGADHLVPVMFPVETLQAMRYLTNENVRREAGVLPTNNYVFPSLKKSGGHASGWHSINYILKKLCMKGVINATLNRHRVTSLLAKLQLSEKENELIFKHFGHSENMNKNKYQAAAGSLQLKTMGKRLQEIKSGKWKSSCSEGNDQCLLLSAWCSTALCIIVDFGDTVSRCLCQA